MLKKSFSPIRIKNPTSLNQQAKIGPGQPIELFLDTDIFGEHSVDVSTELLKVQYIGQDCKVRQYNITHSGAIHDWAEYSSVLLGEIWIDGKNSIGKIGVLMESTNPEKEQVRTVINPDCVDLRMYPHNILEVIAYSPSFGYHDEWNYTWKALKDVEIELMGCDQLCLHSWEHYSGLEMPDYLYSRLPRAEISEGLLTRQHHFWFRLNHKAFSMISKETSIVQVGNLLLSGISNRYQVHNSEKIEYHISVYVDFRKKNYKLMQDTINLKLRHDSYPSQTCGYKQPYKQPSSVPYVPAKTVWVPPPKEILPEIRDVDIKLVEISGDVVSGCKTLETLNETYKPSFNYGYNDYWDEDFYDYPQYPKNHHQHHQSHWRKWD